MPHETVAVAPLGPPAAEVRSEIERNIDRLADLAAPVPGISEETGGGLIFSPLDGVSLLRTGAFRAGATLHDSIAIRDLVHRGPLAILTLLAHLDDARPTRLRVDTSADGPTGMRIHVVEVSVNEASTEERVAVEAVFPGQPEVWDWDHSPEWEEEAPWEPQRSTLEHPHIVTVGDACFVALGQIVNRPYEAVRYQPTLHVHVSSPTHEPRIAAAVRRQWAGRDPSQALAQRLVADFHTRGDDTEEVQVGAAMRLLWFFPTVGVPLVVDRLASLHTAREDHEGWQEDGVAAEALIDGVAWSTDPRVRAGLRRFLHPGTRRTVTSAVLTRWPAPADPEDVATLRRLRRSTDDAAVYLQCLDILAPAADEQLHEELRRHARIAHRTTGAPTRELLLRLGRAFPDRAAAAYVEHLEYAGPPSHVTVLAVLEDLSDPVLSLAVAPLLLRDARPVPGRARVGSVRDLDDVRVLDWAAALLARARADLVFDVTAAVAERDQHAAAIRSVLDAERAAREAAEGGLR